MKQIKRSSLTKRLVFPLLGLWCATSLLAACTTPDVQSEDQPVDQSESQPNDPSDDAPNDILTFDGNPPFSGGTYAPLNGSLDILRQGTLETDSDGCLMLNDGDMGIHPVLFPRGTFVEEDGTIQVPGEFVVRREGQDDQSGHSIRYRVDSEIRGSGPEISPEQAHNGVEGVILPEGCYGAVETSFYLLVP